MDGREDIIMLFLLPEDIVKTYQPQKNVHVLSAMDLETRRKFDTWKPCAAITIEELDRILVRQFHMKKVIIGDGIKGALLANLKQEDIQQQYMCSYVFANADDWKRWAMADEVELGEFLQEIREGNIEKLENEIENETNPTKITELEYRLTQEHANYQLETNKLLHVLSENGIHFHGMHSEGAIPRIIRFSLFHLSGKAPVPEETYSEWHLYLQFLIEIGYI